MGTRRQGIFWMLTIPHHGFVPYPIANECQWIRGQLEVGERGEPDEGYVHWQILVAFRQKKSRRAVRNLFGPFHCQLSRSEAAAEYVWKEHTRVEGTQFEFGERPFQRNSKVDWDRVWEAAKAGNLMEIPAHVRLQSYRTIRQIGSDYAEPVGMVRTCYVFWGRTGTGKSREAWSAAGMGAYPKDPRTKFWCGYKGQSNVIIDEFCGGIDISHMLRWLDRYPVIVEIKGGSRCLNASSYWITSNVDPRNWYPEASEEQKAALLRRLVITHYDGL